MESVSEDSDPLTSTTLSQTDRDYLIKTGLPGVAADQIEVVVHNDQVMIRAEVIRSVQNTEEGATRLDRVVERFYRSVALQGASSIEGATAVLEGDVLRITIPRSPAQPPHRLVVEEGKPQPGSGIVSCQTSSCPGYSGTGTASVTFWSIQALPASQPLFSYLCRIPQNWHGICSEGEAGKSQAITPERSLMYVD